MIKESVSVAQEKWTNSDHWDREQMLKALGYSGSFSKLSWKKLPYMVKDNLQRTLEKRK